MSFTEDEKLKIGEIVEMDQMVLQSYLDFYAARITDGVEAYVRDLLNKWDDVKDDFTDVMPNDKNFGASIAANRPKVSIRKQVSLALFLPVSSGDKLVRG